MPAPYKQDINKYADILDIDPRLQLYIEKKKFNLDNNIKNSISEEKEFRITRYDMTIIKNYLKGLKNNDCDNPDLIKPDKYNGKVFGMDPKKDPRHAKMLEKVEANKAARKKISNLDGVSNFENIMINMPDIENTYNNSPTTYNDVVNPVAISKPENIDLENQLNRSDYRSDYRSDQEKYDKPKLIEGFKNGPRDWERETKRGLKHKKLQHGQSNKNYREEFQGGSCLLM